MRIALVHPYAWPDVRRGGERYLDDLAWYLRNAGHDVDVIAGTSGASNATPTGSGKDVRLHQLRNVWRGPIRMGPPETFGLRAYPTLVRNRYDVVHALVPSAALAAKAAGQRVALTLLGFPSAELVEAHPMKRRVLRAALRVSDAVTALSTEVALDVEKTFGRLPAVVPPGVRTERFAPSDRDAVPTVLFASAMRPEKGLDVLLAAFAILAARDQRVRLVLSGPGDPQWAFDAHAEALREVLDRIDVVGPGNPEDLPGRYARAHVTVLPSRGEAFGLVLAESLASGTPVVGCYGGGADDIVTPEVGRLVAFGNPVALADAMSQALALSSATSACIKRSKLWDWTESVGPQHEDVYSLVVV